MSSCVPRALRLLVLVCTACVVVRVDGIPATIKPMDPTTSVGSDITLHCVLNTSATSYTAKDIIWYFKSYRHKIPRSQYHVEDNISHLSRENLTITDSGAYFCALESDGVNMMRYQGSMLRVGAPPSPPMGLRCHSANMLDFWCEWKESLNTNLRTHQKFSYRQRHGGTVWKECPKGDGRGDNTCLVSRHHNNGFTQQIRVTASNHLGSATSELYFDPSSSTVPNPPSSVSVVTLGSEELRVTWSLPPEWDDQIFPAFLEYRIEVSPEQGTTVRMIPDVAHGEPYLQTRRYTVGNLLPHITYNVRTSCRSVASFDDDHWSVWSKTVSRQTAEAVPNAAVSKITGQEYDNSADPAYRRDVFLKWSELPTANKRGTILGYDVDLRMASPDGTSNVVRTIRANATMVLIEGLEKFREYYVDVAVRNSAGRGPVASYFLADKTSEPGAPINVRIQNISETSLLVSWQRPEQPNGYINGYYVEWSKGADGQTAGSFVEASESQTSYMIDNLEPNKLYQFRVKTSNSRGYSGWSNTPIQHTGGGSRVDLLRTLITVLHSLMVDMLGEGEEGNQVTLETISTYL